MVDAQPETDASGLGVRARARLSRLEKPALALAVLALTLALGRAWSFGTEVPNADYYQYWVVGHALRSDPSVNIYGEKERVRLAGEAWIEAHREARQLDRDTLRKQSSIYRRYELGTYATPWLYTVFGWSIGDDYDADQRAFQRVSLLSLVVSVLVLAWLVGASPLVAVLWALFSITLFAPLLSEVRVGNVNRIQLLLLAMSLLALRLSDPRLRAALAGLILTLAVLFKPSLAAAGLMLAIGWLLTRRFRELGFAAGSGIVGGVIAIAISSAHFGGLEAWATWLMELRPLLAEFDHNVGKGNFSLVRVARDGLGFGHSVTFALVFVGGTAVALWAGSRSSDAERSATDSRASDDADFALDYLMIGLGGLMPVLASDLAWYHYYILTLPLFVFALRPSQAPVSRSRVISRAVTFAALACVATTPIRPLVGAPGPLVMGTLVSLGALALYGVALYELVDRSRSAGPASRRPEVAG